MPFGSGESLDRLIRSMNPVLRGGAYVFCALAADAAVPAGAIAVFREAEATTIVIERSDAEADRLDPLYVAAWITLTVHSELDAVGFLAAITNALAASGISCNVFSAVHHDHLFVPYEQGERAVEILRALQLSPSP
ncbi:MAG TPA: ACT domain-containing protein [Thermoanaerobaculia bacterium]|jgi:hypothetical protein